MKVIGRKAVGSGGWLSGFRGREEDDRDGDDVTGEGRDELRRRRGRYRALNFE